MKPAWLPAFTVAGTVTLAATPLLRRLALRIDLVDHPGPRKIHTAPVPYLGGVAIAFGALAGLAVAPATGWQPGAIAAGAAAVAAVGLLDDDRDLGTFVRLAVETIAAAATVAAGLRLEATGAAPVDALVTVVWIVGLANALNLLDNMDGLAAGVAATIGVSTLLLASGPPGTAPWVTTLAAVATAASLAFVAFNVTPPVKVFMGDAGSLLLGYLLAVGILGAARPLPSRPSLAVPALLAAVPIADTATVIAGRFRHRRSIACGGTDHLSHRLVARGLPPAGAVAVLVGASLAAGVLGSLAGSGGLPLGAAVAGGAVMISALLVVALPGSVYDEPVTGLSPRLRVALATVVVGSVTVVAAGLAPVGAGRRVVHPLRAGAPAAAFVAGKGPDARAEPAGPAPEGGLSSAPVAAASVAGLTALLGVVVRQRRRRSGHPPSGTRYDEIEIVLPPDGSAAVPGATGRDDGIPQDPNWPRRPAPVLVRRGPDGEQSSR